MTPRRVFVRLPNWLGDLLMSRPLLHALRAAVPGGRIAVTGTAPSRLLERESVWDAWEPWPPAARERSDLWRERYDAAVVLPPSFSSAWTLPRGIPVRVGFAADGRSPLLTRAIRRPARGDLHLSDEYMRLGEPLGAGPVAVPALSALEQERDQARERLRGLQWGERPYAVLGPGASYGPAKRWIPERFVELGRRFTARGLGVLVCGAAEDRGIAEPIAAAIGSNARSLAGRTMLGEQLALCAAARVTVSNDSGLAHLAAAADAPTVVIFGSTSSAWTAPRGRRVAVVQKAPVCSPCFRRSCRIGYRCLEAVRVGDVERACEEAAA